jgi:hypothetical protein
MARNLPLFLITLPRTAKSQEIFNLNSLCHISIGVEAYRAQSGLTQCHNCQQFGHVWANCRQPPRCMWCGGGHWHKECPKENASSTPVHCNCQLVEGEKSHSANYRGCRHAKEELQKKKLQRTTKPTNGRAFSSNFISPCVSFVAVRQGNARATVSDTPTTSFSSTPSQEIECRDPCTGTRNRSVSSGSNRKQSTPRQYARRQNSGHH